MVFTIICLFIGAGVVPSISSDGSTTNTIIVPDDYPTIQDTIYPINRFKSTSDLKIYGKVLLYPTGNSVNNAKVKIWSGAILWGENISDIDGFYEINIPYDDAPKYIIAEKSGLEMSAGSIWARDGELSINKDLWLAPKNSGN